MSIESNKTDEGSCASVPAAIMARPKDGKAAERADPPVPNPRANVRESKRAPFCGTRSDHSMFSIPVNSFRLQTTHTLSLPRSTMQTLPLLRLSPLLFKHSVSSQNQPLRFLTCERGYRMSSLCIPLSLSLCLSLTLSLSQACLFVKETDDS
jgi:hypothetical protein